MKPLYTGASDVQAEGTQQDLPVPELDKHNGPKLRLDLPHAPQHESLKLDNQAVLTRDTRHADSDPVLVLGSLEVESPGPDIKDSTTSFGELKPMERFLEETCGVPSDMLHMQTYPNLSSEGAVKSTSKKSGNPGDGLPEVDRDDDEPALTHSGTAGVQSEMVSMAGTWCDDEPDTPVCTDG
jgi:hypothetical protein